MTTLMLKEYDKKEHKYAHTKNGGQNPGADKADNRVKSLTQCRLFRDIGAGGIEALPDKQEQDSKGSHKYPEFGTVYHLGEDYFGILSHHKD